MIALLTTARQAIYDIRRGQSTKFPQGSVRGHLPVACGFPFFFPLSSYRFFLTAGDLFEARTLVGGHDVRGRHRLHPKGKKKVFHTPRLALASRVYRSLLGATDSAAVSKILMV